MPTLPIPADEFATRLSRTLAPRPDGLQLTVTDPVLTIDRLRLLVHVTNDANPRGQRWEVKIPVDPVDFDPDVVVSSLVVTLRANLEEWWDVQNQEPAVAAWGRRIG